MPLFYPDENEFVKCKCGSKLLTEENVCTVKRSQGRKGETLVKSLVATRLVCIVCRKTVIEDVRKSEIAEE